MPTSTCLSFSTLLNISLRNVLPRLCSICSDFTCQQRKRIYICFVCLFNVFFLHVLICVLIRLLFFSHVVLPSVCFLMIINMFPLGGTGWSENSHASPSGFNCLIVLPVPRSNNNHPWYHMLSLSHTVHTYISSNMHTRTRSLTLSFSLTHAENHTR